MMNDVLMISLGVIVGACVMYLWSHRAHIRCAGRCNVGAYPAAQLVALTLDERTYMLSRVEARSIERGLRLAQEACDKPILEHIEERRKMSAEPSAPRGGSHEGHVKAYEEHTRVSGGDAP
jgi:hypothetical protein